MIQINKLITGRFSLQASSGSGGGGSSSTPTPKAYFVYDDNRYITGLTKDESVNEYYSDCQLYDLKSENANVVDDYALGITSLTGVDLQYGVGVDSQHLLTITMKNVTTIGQGAFYYQVNMTSASFASCTSVDDNAFDCCSSLTSVSLPKCTSIGEFVFQFTNLQSLDISSIESSTVNRQILTSWFGESGVPSGLVIKFKDCTKNASDIT